MSGNQKWTTENILDQSGKIVIVTGANSGIGYEASLVVAHIGAEVIMTCRSLEKAEIAAGQIRTIYPKGQVSVSDEVA